MFKDFEEWCQQWDLIKKTDQSLVMEAEGGKLDQMSYLLDLTKKQLTILQKLDF